MNNLRWLEKSYDVGNGMERIERVLQYEGVSEPIHINIISDAPPKALIAMTDKGLAYYLSEWKAVPTISDSSPTASKKDTE